MWAVPEGTPVFPGEPLVTVKGPAIQAQFIETMLLLTLNHQTLIATKASRLVRAAEGRVIFEFGSRRAQGFDGAVYGARAAYIGGCAATACTLSDQYFGVPAVGTMAHSWVQMFDSEYEAFKAYAELYPSGCTLLVDTYNTLQSGIPNAIRVFDEVLAPWAPSGGHPDRQRRPCLSLQKGRKCSTKRAILTAKLLPPTHWMNISSGSLSFTMHSWICSAWAKTSLLPFQPGVWRGL